MFLMLRLGFSAGANWNGSDVADVFSRGTYYVVVGFFCGTIHGGRADEPRGVTKRGALMKKLVALLAIIGVSCAPQAAVDKRVVAWEQQAQTVTIIRDNWGIAHVYGKTDADAVFGVMYAQAEDDFNRVETNYLNSMGRLAEAEGQSEVYRDLRMKIFIDPEDMRAQYQKSPQWLKALMNAWADGLNFYLRTHPNASPRVI